MNTIYAIVAAIQVCMALIIIGLVLVQHGKGADMGAAFGSGASGSLFGATGSSSFLSKATGVAATLFFCATLGLAYIGNQHASSSSDGVMGNLASPKVHAVTEAVPAKPAPASGVARSTVTSDESSPASSVPSKAGSKSNADQIPK